MHSIDVLSPGTECFILLPGDKDPIPGAIVAVQIGRGDAVQYEVVWWNGNTRSTEWLHPWEVRAESQADRYRIGFFPIPSRQDAKEKEEDES